MKYSRANENIDSVIDLACLPLQSIGGYLSHLFTKSRTCVDIALTFLTSTLNPSRDCTVSDNPDTPNNAKLWLSRQIGTLVYQVLRRTYKPNGAADDWVPSGKLMQLTLPVQFTESLTTVLANESLLSIIDRLNRYATSYAKNNPGLTPTVKRLSISGRTRVLHPCMDSIAAATIGGGFRARHGATGDYPRFDLGHLNLLYRTAFNRFIEELAPHCSPELREYLATLTFPNHLPIGTTGSHIDFSREDYRVALKELYGRVHTVFEDAMLCHSSSRLPTYINALNLQNAYLYTLQQVGLCARPNGPQSRIIFTGEEFLIGDKNSKHEEIGYSPLTVTLRNQMQACESDIQDFLHWLSAYRYQKPKPCNTHLARVFEYDKCSNRVKITVMQHADFVRILESNQVCCASPLLAKNNANRHTNATVHPNHLPESLVNEFMHHKVDGRDYLGEWSTGTVDGLIHLADVVEDLLSFLSPKPLAFSDWRSVGLSGFVIAKAKPSGKPLRTYCLPKNRADAIHLSGLRQLRDYLLDSWLTTPRSRPEREFACLALMIFYDGLSLPLLDALSRITPTDVDHNGIVELPISPDDIGAARHRWKPQCAARGQLHRLLLDTPAVTPVFSILQPPAEQSRRQYERLHQQYAQFKVAFDKAHKLKAPGLNILIALSPWMAWKNRVEAWSLNVLRQSPFPRDARFSTSATDGYAHIPPAGIFMTHILPRPGKRLMRPTEPLEPSAWHNSAKRLLRKLVIALRKITPEYFDTPDRCSSADDAFRTYLAAADAIGPATSALHLIIRWLKHKIDTANGRIKVSSLHLYLKRIVYTTFFDSETDSGDLSDWYPEDYLMLIEERLDDDLAPKTLADTLWSFGELFRFAADIGFCEPIDLSEFTERQGESPCSSIPPLIGLLELDRCLQRCLDDGSREALRQGAATALMGYGTARPVELSRLSLADAFGESDLFAEIRGSKTRAGKRRILFTDVASPVAHTVVERYLALRCNEFSDLPNRSLRDISYFGEPADPRRQKPSVISRYITQFLRPIFGAGFVAYQLRHAAISWLFVRLEVLREPRLLDQLPCRNAPVFCQDAQTRLARLFTGGASDTLQPWDTTHMHLFAKLCGHRSPCTTFRFYIHTAALIQHMRVDLIDQTHGHRKLDPRVIAQLAPRTRIPEDYKHLPSTSLLVLCARLANKRKCRKR